MNDIIKSLRAAARIELDDESKNVIINMANDSVIYREDLNYFFEHRIAHLLFNHVINIGEVGFEKKLGRQMGAELAFLQEKYKEYIEYLREIVKRFDENSIDYSLLKGFSIIDSLYNDNGIICRDFGDVDVLVNKKDVGAVTKILNELGFIQGTLDENYNIQKASRKDILYWSLNSHQEHSFCKKSKYSNIIPFLCCVIDVNSTIFEGGKIESPISTEQLLTEVRKHTICDGVEINSLNYEMELIQICYHFYKDLNYESKGHFAKYSLYKFCDIREYILKYSEVIDWEYFVTCVKKYNISIQVGIALLYVAKFYDDNKVMSIFNLIGIDEKDISIPNWEEVLL